MTRDAPPNPAGRLCWPSAHGVAGDLEWPGREAGTRTRPDHDPADLGQQQKGNAQPGGEVGRVLVPLMLVGPGWAVQPVPGRGDSVTSTATARKAPRI